MPGCPPALLAHHDLGGTGPVVLLLHANSLHGRCFLPMVQQVLGHSYRCIALDVPGHGDSAAATAEQAADLVGFVTASVYHTVCHLGLQGCRAFGHSFGGMLLLNVESHHPGTFTCIYVFEAPTMTRANREELLHREAAAGVQPAGYTLAAMARKRRWQWASQADALAHLAAKPPFSLWNQGALRAYITWGTRPVQLAAGTQAGPHAAGSHSHSHPSEGSAGSTAPDGEQGQQAQLQPQGPVQLCCLPSTEERVYLSVEPPLGIDTSPVQCPVAWAVTASDPGLHSRLPGLGRAAVSELKQGVLCEFPHLSHFGPMEAPTAVAQDVAQFFEQAAAGKLSASCVACRPDGGSRAAGSTHAARPRL